jgi:CheY-specific phosphatase CheX
VNLAPAASTTPSLSPSTPPALRREALREIVTTVVLEFFESYGVACVPAEVVEGAADDGGSALGAIIALRGKAIQGGLAFVAPVELVAKLLPVPPKTDGKDRQVRDWCSEMANQLLGRLKNKLVAYSIDFHVGTPVCFFGRSIRLVFLPDAEGVSLAFRSEGHDMRVHLDCSFDPGAPRAAADRPRIAAEGEVMLF